MSASVKLDFFNPIAIFSNADITLSEDGYLYGELAVAGNVLTASKNGITRQLGRVPGGGPVKFEPLFIQSGTTLSCSNYGSDFANYALGIYPALSEN